VVSGPFEDGFQGGHALARLEEEDNGFPQRVECVFDCVTQTGDVQFRAKRDDLVVFMEQLGGISDGHHYPAVQFLKTLSGSLRSQPRTSWMDCPLAYLIESIGPSR
jgi:hypothetical protein